MSRAFIPCIYHEWESDAFLDGVLHTRYDAIELFDVCWLDGREVDVVMTRDSHQYHVGTAQTERERLDAPATRALHARQARVRLFRTFYEDLS